MRGLRETTAPRRIFFSLFLFSLLALAAGPTLWVTAQDYTDFSRVIVTFPSALSYTLEKSDAFLELRIRSSETFELRSDPVQSRLIKSFSWVKGGNFYSIVIEARDSRFRFETFKIERRRQLMIDFYPLEENPAPLPPQAEQNAAEPAAERKEASLPEAAPAEPAPKGTTVSQKRLKTIVIDPGHGGLESGAKGKFGALEKDITLAIALKLKAQIERSLAFQVELTRDKDMDVSLENRAATANNHKAELFISIHTNSSYRRNAQGSETFFLSLNATDEEARRLAYLENNPAEPERPLAQDSKDEIMMILWDMAQTAYLKQSQRLAEIVQDELNSLLGTADRGIKQAPFKVLTGVACPAVLVEVAFLSNPAEEKELVDDVFQGSVAQAIYRGLVNYIKITS